MRKSVAAQWVFVASAVLVFFVMVAETRAQISSLNLPSRDLAVPSLNQVVLWNYRPSGGDFVTEMPRTGSESGQVLARFSRQMRERRAISRFV